MCSAGQSSTGAHFRSCRRRSTSSSLGRPAPPAYPLPQRLPSCGSGPRPAAVPAAPRRAPSPLIRSTRLPWVTGWKTSSCVLQMAASGPAISRSTGAALDIQWNLKEHRPFTPRAAGLAPLRECLLVDHPVHQFRGDCNWPRNIDAVDLLDSPLPNLLHAPGPQASPGRT